ncbi:type II toxin-antitoxin system PemK/MazF family toxin [Nocardioides sp. AE5]|uniref:type II toxin-antitoxin system PemK/MazF family toxin n=1 Tax=Nocardioides sp. AE5 TaxID=2962573 RepID=UPI0028821DB9|nr:type II toxin-antitoxin system PemK/MazF family toxin [Nocardioides sp. AE5]MDT0202936.1 type II toxin-antitoxin system PemK/MazF family toxin [Nocardioides sp. AE5]
MRPIRLARMEKTRPVLVLTRERALDAMSWVTVAPITSTVKGLFTEVPVGPANGLDHSCVISCDNLQTIPTSQLGRTIGLLHESQEPALARALASAFDLRVEDLT